MRAGSARDKTLRAATVIQGCCGTASSPSNPRSASIMWMHRVLSPATQIAGLLVALTIGPGAIAGELEAFVVLPDGGAHYAGPLGRESTVTELLATRAQTGGALGLFRQTIPAQSGPPAHIHRDADEFFYVISGNFDFKLGDRIVNAPAGSVVFIPKGTVHNVQKQRVRTGRAAGRRHASGAGTEIRRMAARGCGDSQGNG